MPNKLRVILFAIIVCSFSSKAATIKGRLSLDNTWEPLVYLSLINSFDDLQTASFDFLIQQATIDSLGYFEFTNLTIPDDNRLYRLHICKKGDPVSTIMIGGKDENFFHFIMNAASDITISPHEKQAGIKHSILKGNKANSSLAFLLSIQKDLQTPPGLPSKQNRELIKNQAIKTYYHVADTSSIPIIKLMSAWMILEATENHDLGFLKNLENELKTTDTASPYYQAFSDRVEYLRFQSGEDGFSNPGWIKWLGLLVLLVFLGLGYWMRVRKYLKAKTKPKNELVNTLSVQEKKVFDLLRTGASNKEISHELNIEVSTVKSHVHKIYSRLGVKSRKEIVNREW